jgi:hypothetical protein
MAWAKGRQAAIETAKAECRRRWPKAQLSCRAVYFQTRREGFIVEAKGRFIAGERSASEAWRTALARLESEHHER